MHPAPCDAPKRVTEQFRKQEKKTEVIAGRRAPRKGGKKNL
jgi:hypothetical protein